MCAFQAIAVAAQEPAAPVTAPPNPAFVQHQLSLQGGRLLRQTGDGYPLGYVPSPLDFSHLTNQPLTRAGKDALGLPATYDLRSLGRLPAIRDQGSCGSCWAFAAMGSLESNLLTAESWNFSENNLKNTHGFDWGHCDGGNADIAVAYLARWSGAISETDDPYNAASSSSPTGLTVRKHLQEVVVIPDRTGPTDNDAIKQAVTAYGAVYTTMYYSGSYYNAATHAYYYDGSSANHAVTIVGWDDTYNRGNFSPSAPPGDGAFIVRNSWGTWWGDSGYFYISYYDSRVGKENYVFRTAQSTTNYTRAYQYDTLGWTTSTGYGSTTGWLANVFTAAATEQVAAASFYTASPNATYTLYVYTNVGSSGPTGGTLAGTQSGTIADAGYHTITLSTPVTVTSGQKFSVVVRLTTPGYTYPIAIEYPVGGYSSAATASSGQSYMSSNGSNWTDVAGYYSNTNVCLKAFMKAPACSYSISPSSQSFAASSLTGTIAVTTTTGCSWSATSYDPWITITSGSTGNGSGTVAYSVSQNTAKSSRSGTVAVAGSTFTATQSGTGTRVGAVPGDIDGDGKPDILWQNQVTGNVGVWAMNGTTALSYTPFTPGTVADTNWKIVGVTDFNADNEPDLLWQHQTSGYIGVWLMNGTTQASWSFLTPAQVTDANWKIVGVGDFNADGKPDILWQHQTSGSLGVWIMNGTTVSSYVPLNPSAVTDTSWKIRGPK
jgi:C1A family cysteine protease